MRHYLLISALMAAAAALGNSSSPFVQSDRRQVGAERIEPQAEARRELERSERQMRAAQEEQIRQAQERGNEQRREEWRASAQARQQPPVVVEQRAEEQPQGTDAPAPVTPNSALEAPQPVPATFPALRLGLALFAGITVFGSGWALYRLTER